MMRRRQPRSRRISAHGRNAAPLPMQGAEVLLVGYFTAKNRQYEEAMAELAAQVTAAGARVVRQFVQRRGVSHGGVRKMALPLSRRTLIGPGKVREIAEVRQETGAQAVIFINQLTDHQREALENAFECRVLSASAFQ